MAHTLFPQWIGRAEANMTDEMCKSRIRAVDAIAETATVDLALALVRFYLEKRLSDDSRNSLLAAFSKFDTTLLVGDVDYALRIMAGATLLQMLTAQTSSALVAALALQANSRSQPDDACIPVLFSSVTSYLQTASAEVRVLEPSSFTEIDIKGLRSQLKELKEDFQSQPTEDETDLIVDQQKLLNTLEVTVDSIDDLGIMYARAARAMMTLNEETNILWWVFGEALQPRYSSVAPTQACASVLTGMELADQILQFPPPVSSSSILKKFNKGFGIEIARDLNLVDAINDLPRSIRTEIAKTVPSNGPLDLVPVMAALTTSLSTDGLDDWFPIYSKTVGQPLGTMKAQDVSDQVFWEAIFLRVVRDATK